MRKVIKDKDGKVLGCWVARTIRGFNAKQRAEILAVQKANGMLTRFHIGDRVHYPKLGWQGTIVDILNFEHPAIYSVQFDHFKTGDTCRQIESSLYAIQ